LAISGYYDENEKKFEEKMKSFTKIYTENMINYFEFRNIKKFIEFIEKKEGNYSKLYKKYFIETGIMYKFHIAHSIWSDGKLTKKEYIVLTVMHIIEVLCLLGVKVKEEDMKIVIQNIELGNFIKINFEEKPKSKK
jgi:hypothetical protein